MLVGEGRAANSIALISTSASGVVAPASKTLPLRVSVVKSHRLSPNGVSPLYARLMFLALKLAVAILAPFRRSRVTADLSI